MENGSSFSAARLADFDVSLIDPRLLAEADIDPPAAVSAAPAVASAPAPSLSSVAGPAAAPALAPPGPLALAPAHQTQLLAQPGAGLAPASLYTFREFEGEVAAAPFCSSAGSGHNYPSPPATAAALPAGGPNVGQAPGAAPHGPSYFYQHDPFSSVLTPSFSAAAAASSAPVGSTQFHLAGPPPLAPVSSSGFGLGSAPAAGSPPTSPAQARADRRQARAAAPLPAPLPPDSLVTDDLSKEAKAGNLPATRHQGLANPVPDGVCKYYWSRVYNRADSAVYDRHRARNRSRSRNQNSAATTTTTTTRRRRATAAASVSQAARRSGETYRRAVRRLVQHIVESLPGRTKAGLARTRAADLRATTANLTPNSPLICWLRQHHGITLAKSTWLAPGQHLQTRGQFDEELGFCWETDLVFRRPGNIN